MSLVLLQEENQAELTLEGSSLFNERMFQCRFSCRRAVKKFIARKQATTGEISREVNVS